MRILTAALFIWLSSTALAVAQVSDDSILGPAPKMEAPAASSDAPAATAEDVPPAAPGQAGGIALSTPEDDAKADAAYDAVFVKMTPAHQDELQKLDHEFTLTMRPVMQIFRMGAELEFCLQQGHALAGKDEKYVAAFKNFRDERDADQEKLWSQHRAIANKITYIDHSLLDAHFRSQAAIAARVGQQLMLEGAEKGDFEQTDCTAVQKKLDEAAQIAPKPAPTAPK